MSRASIATLFVRLLLVALLSGLLPAAPLAVSASGAATPASAAAPAAPAVLKVAPLADAHLPSLTLHIAVNPAVVAVGDTAAVELTIANQAPDPADDLVVTLPTPGGALALPGPNTLGAAQGWRWNVGRLDAHASATLRADLRLTRTPAGQALLLHAQASARGLSLPIHEVGGALARDPRVAASSAAGASFVPGAPAQLNSADGRVRVRFPANASAQALTLRHSATPLPGAAPLPADAARARGFGVFYLDATDAQGRAVHHFDHPLTISVAYTPEQLLALGIAENDLALFWFDPARRTWTPIPTSVDPATHSATALVDHFSPFQLSDGSSASDAFIPSVQGFQVSTFTGAASYNYPLDLPAGPGGLKPSLDLSYSSAATDGLTGIRVKQQAGWVGKGWSLNPDAIARNKLSNGDSTFSLILNGQSYAMVRGAALPGSPYSPGAIMGWDWTTTDDAALRIRATSDDSWSVWTKDGTRFDYTTTAIWGWGTSGRPAFETYKWMLTTVTDTHGNTISYTYNRQQGGGAYGPVDVDIWPSTITWAGGRYRVTFASSARTNDTQFESADNQYVAGPHETQQLNAILVESNAAGTWQLVRQYNLTYDYSLLADTLVATGCPTGQAKCGDPNYPKLTLKSIQRIGNDGASALPATTFAYGGFSAPYVNGRYWVGGDWNRLARIDNGQGGVTSLAYANVGQAVNSTLMENNRRITARTVSDGRGHSYTWSYDYGTPTINTLGTTRGPQSPWGNGNYGTQAYPNSAALYYNAFTDPAHDYRASLSSTPMREFRGHDWVTEIAPTGAQTKHFFRQGEASDRCIPTVTYTNITGDACFQRLRDGEFLKGKEYATQMLSPSGSLLQETDHTFVVIFSTYTSTPRTGLWGAFTAESQTDEKQSEGTSTPAIKTARTFYNVGCAADTTATVVYGNIGCVQEYNNGALVRQTKRWYAANDVDSWTWSDSSGNLLNPPTYTVRYLVDRMWQEAIYNGSGGLLALTNNFYDSTSSSGTVGAKGELLRASKYYDLPWPPQSNTTNITLHSTDTSFTYDAYGNPTTETTYAGAGTRLNNGSTVTYSAPGSGSAARTTTTAYDGTFHTFPTQVTNALGQIERADYNFRMGTLLRVTGPNTTGAPTDCRAGSYSIPATEQSTCAQYDVFGRMFKLIKPGDSVSVPTLQAYYYDAELPFRYMVTYREISGQGGNRPIQIFYDGMGRKIQTKSESVDGTQNIVVDTRYDGLNHVTEQSQSRYVSETSTSFFAYTAPAATLYNVTTTSYDALGRPLRITTPDGKWTEHLYSTVVVGSTSYTFDDVVDPNRHRVQYRRDALGRLAYVFEISGDCGTSSFSWASCTAPYTTQWTVYSTTTYAYTDLDMLASSTDATGNVTSMLYDSLGRKTQINDPDMGLWRYSYDANGNLTTQTDAKGQVLWFGYDALNRLTQKRQTSGSGAQLATYAYDAGTYGKGQRSSMSVPGGASTTWTYDARGRKTQATHVVAGLTRTFQWSYDTADRVQTITYPAFPNGIIQTITYGYDAAWRPTRLYTSNWNVNLISGATYTALDQPDQWTFYTGLIQNYTYTSPMQRLNRFQVGPSASPSSIFDRSYSYDNAGNVTAITDSSGTPIPAQSFAYDHRDRLTSWTSGTTTQTYAYSTIGNLTSKAGVAYAYGTQSASCPNGALSNPHTVVTVGTAGLCYDPNGNLVNDGGRQYTWNINNQPTRVSQTSGTDDYGYDADGERVTVARGGVTTIYLEGMWEEPVGGAPKAYYSFNGQVAVMYTYSPSAFYYLHNDHLGSLSAVTGGGGTLVSEQEFDPWGKVRSGGVSVTGLNYTGQRLDATGLLYYHARMYDPSLARFTSADSVVPGVTSGKGGGAATLGENPDAQLKPLTVNFQDPGFTARLNAEDGVGFWFQLNNDDRRKVGSPWGPTNPQALNRYSYVLNNPVRYTDPTGHTVYMTKSEAAAYVAEMRQLARDLREVGNILSTGGTVSGAAGSMAARAAENLFPLLRKAGIIGAAAGWTSIVLGQSMLKWAEQIDIYASLIERVNQDGDDGVIIAADPVLGGSHVTIVSRASGNGYTMPMAYGPAAFAMGPFDVNNVWRTGRACTRRGHAPGSGNWYGQDTTMCQ